MFATFCFFSSFQVADLTAESGKINLLEKMVADLTIELSMMSSSSSSSSNMMNDVHGRRLDHNSSLGSIYEFPQMGGGPIYSAGSHPYITTFAPGQRPILPGSGDKGRPTYYTNAVNPTQGQTSVGNQSTTSHRICFYHVILGVCMLFNVFDLPIIILDQ